MDTDTSTPGTSGSRFGWPRPRRIEEFRRLADARRNDPNGGPTERVVFQGKNLDIPIYRVPIDLPKYRLENGRTVSLQAEYLAQNGGVRRDMFSGDPELWEAQELQHELLLRLCAKTDLQKYFEDETRVQVNPIILDENGFVVNGNRRLACWRELVHDDGKKYGHFSHIDIAVLPHCDEREIDRLEASLQIEKDIKLDYSWDARANMMFAKQNKDGFSNEELARLYGLKESEVVELLDMRTYAEEYLRSRGKENRWSLVEEDEYAFKQIVKFRQKLDGKKPGEQELFKQAAYNLIEKPEDVPGRLYEAIPLISENIEQVRKKLAAEFEVAAAAPDPSIEDLFGGGPAPKGGEQDIPLATEIQKPENAAKARQILVDVIETQKQLKRDSKAEAFLLKCCSQANASLAAAIKDGLRPESKIKGVAEQIDEIVRQAEQIKEFLLKRNAKH